MTYQPNDADTVLADFGVPVSWTGAPVGVLGIETFGVDAAQLGPVAGGELLAGLGVDHGILSVKPGTLAAVDIDTRLLVNGKPYRLRDRVADGQPSIFDRYLIAPADA